MYRSESKEIKLSLHRDDINDCLCRNLPVLCLKLVSEFSKGTGYKIQKSITFLYTNNKNIKTEIKTLIPFLITPKK